MRGRRTGVATALLALLTLAGCGTTANPHTSPGAPRPATSAPGDASTPASTPAATTPAACRAGAVRQVVAAGDSGGGRLCLHPYATLTVVLLPRPGSRWTSLTASGPAGRGVHGWRLDPDGTAQVELTAVGGAGTTVNAYGTGSTGPLWTMTLDVEPVPQPT